MATNKSLFRTPRRRNVGSDTVPGHLYFGFYWYFGCPLLLFLPNHHKIKRARDESKTPLTVRFPSFLTFILIVDSMLISTTHKKSKLIESMAFLDVEQLTSCLSDDAAIFRDTPLLSRPDNILFLTIYTHNFRINHGYSFI